MTRMSVTGCTRRTLASVLVSAAMLTGLAGVPLMAGCGPDPIKLNEQAGDLRAKVMKTLRGAGADRFTEVTISNELDIDKGTVKTMVGGRVNSEADKQYVEEVVKAAGYPKEVTIEFDIKVVASTRGPSSPTPADGAGKGDDKGSTPPPPGGKDAGKPGGA